MEEIEKLAGILRTAYERCTNCKRDDTSDCADCDAEAIYEAGYRQLPKTDKDKVEAVAEKIADSHGYVYPSRDTETDDSMRFWAKQILKVLKDFSMWREIRELERRLVFARSSSFF